MLHRYPKYLLEESLLGWKEYEMEVIRDRVDNWYTSLFYWRISTLWGLHTGDSHHRCTIF